MQGHNSEKELWCVVHKKIVADVVFTLPMALSLVPLRQVGAGLTKVSLHKIFMALEKSDIYVVFCMCTCLTFPFCFFFASLSWSWLVSISLLLLCNKVIHTGQLKWMHIYYLTVFVSQESGNSSVRPSLIRVSQGSYQDIGQDWVLIWWFDWGRIWFTAYMVVGHIKFFVTVEFMTACSFKTKEEGETLATQTVQSCIM